MRKLEFITAYDCVNRGMHILYKELIRNVNPWGSAAWGSAFLWEDRSRRPV